MHETQPNVFLTGAGGLLGSTLLEHLRDAKCSVTALSSQPDMLRERFGDRYRLLDTADFLCNGYDFSSTDVLLHCAFPRNNDSSAMARGLDFQRDVFERAARGGAKAILNVSSQSVYDTKRSTPATEQTPAVLDSKYAVAKYLSEQLADAICSHYNVRCTHLRMASLIGLQFHVRIINRFIQSALEHGRITVHAGHQSFGFLDVRDAAAALCAMLHSDANTWQHVYNVGAAQNWGILPLAELCKSTVEAATGKPLAAFDVVPSEELLCSALDSTTFQTQFGWQPQISIPQFTRELVDSLLAEASSCAFGS